MFGMALARLSLGVLHAMAGGFAMFCLFYTVWYPYLAPLTLKPMLVWGSVAAAAAYVKDHYLAG